jgi:hypothetical protein
MNCGLCPVGAEHTPTHGSRTFRNGRLVVFYLDHEARHGTTRGLPSSALAL